MINLAKAIEAAKRLLNGGDERWDRIAETAYSESREREDDIDLVAKTVLWIDRVTSQADLDNLKERDRE